MHSHPLVNGAKNDNEDSYKLQNNSPTNAIGTSGADKGYALSSKITYYAIETFDKNNFISRVDPGGKTDPHFTKLNDVMTGKFNLFLDAFNNYSQWHR